MSKTNIARFARKGACGSLSVMRTVCVPTASTAPTIDLSSKPANCASQYSKVCPAFTWLSCWGWLAFHQRSKFQTMAAASSGVPSWNFTDRRSWNVHTLPSRETSHFSASAGSRGVRRRPVRGRAPPAEARLGWLQARKALYGQFHHGRLCGRSALPRELARRSRQRGGVSRDVGQRARSPAREGVRQPGGDGGGSHRVLGGPPAACRREGAAAARLVAEPSA